jgi:membrane protease YdiL (CAAX protease family)
MRLVAFVLSNFIIIWIIVTIFNPTINVTIGERDQQTYKILMMNPISLNEIFLGKYLNTTFQGLLGLLPYLFQALMFEYFLISLSIPGVLSTLNFTQVFVLFSAVVTMTTLLSAICFISCCFAKEKTQAQSHLSIIIICLTFPLIMVEILELKLSFFSGLIPIINFPLIVIDVLTGVNNYGAITLGILSNFLFSLALIFFSVGAFKIQWLGHSDNKSISELLTFKRRMTSHLMPAHAYLAFGISSALAFYGGLVLIDFFTRNNLAALGHLLTPIISFGGTALIVIAYSKIDYTKKLFFGNIKIENILYYTVCAGALMAIINYLIAFSDIKDLYGVQIELGDQMGPIGSFVFTLLLVGIIPPLFEELLFRGVIYNGLRSQYNVAISLFLSSAFFAIAHVSLFRLPYTFAAGMILGYIYEKRGLLAAILFHFIFNALGLLTASLKVDWKSFHIGIIPTLLIVMAIAIILFVKRNPKSCIPY